jgi:hypothetical protein
MKFILLDYVKESGWPTLTRAEQEHWLGIYRQYMQTMVDAGVLKSSSGLYPTSQAKTVRVPDQKAQIVDGPFAETKEQLGGFHIIDVPSLDAALSWAAKSPTALHGTVEVRQVREATLLEADFREVFNPA